MENMESNTNPELFPTDPEIMADAMEDASQLESVACLVCDRCIMVEAHVAYPLCIKCEAEIEEFESMNQD